MNDLISDGTKLLDIVEFLEEREVAFVLSHRHIDGYVHFSDFNHHLVKLTFYVILEAAERLAGFGAAREGQRPILVQTPSRIAQMNVQPLKINVREEILGRLSKSRIFERLWYSGQTYRLRRATCEK